MPQLNSHTASLMMLPPTAGVDPRRDAASRRYGSPTRPAFFSEIFNN